MWWVIIVGLLVFVMLCMKNAAQRAQQEYHKTAPHQIVRLAIVVIAFGFVVQRWLINPACNFLSEKAWARTAEAKAVAGGDLYSFRTEFYGISFYLKKMMRRVTDIVPDSGTVFMLRKNLPEFQELAAKNAKVRVSIFNEIPQELVPPEKRIVIVKILPA